MAVSTCSQKKDERYTLATTFLEHASTTTVLNYIIPTESTIDPTAPPPISLQSEHALFTTCYFPPPPTRSQGFVLARVIEDGFTLELRWVAFTSPRENSSNEEVVFNELDQHPGTLQPVRFTFPSRLVVPNLSFNIISTREEEEQEEETSLQILTLSEAGYLYALSFPTDTLFYGLEEEGNEGEWCEEFRVEGLLSENKRKPVLIEGTRDEGRVVIACDDGFVTVVEIAEGTDGALIETELRTPSTFSIRSLVPSFSRHRDLSSTSSSSSFINSPTASPLKLVGSSSTSSSSPSQLVALAISTPTSRLNDSTTFGFGISRDRKLKIWNLDTGNCLRSIDLPKPSSSTNTTSLVTSNPSQQIDQLQQQQHRGSQLLLPETPQNFIKIISTNSDDSSIYSSYLVIYTPPSVTINNSGGTFFVYGLAFGENDGELTQLAPVAERNLPSNGLESSRLVDFQIKRIGLQEQQGEGEEEAKWNLWVLQENGGEVELKVCGLSELEEYDFDENENEDDDEDQDEWKFVSRGISSTSGGEWNAGYFDREIKSYSSSQGEGEGEGMISIPEIFLKHISTPGRYPPASFDYALDVYEDLVLTELEQRGITSPPPQFEQEYPSLLIRSAAIVGSQVELEYSPQTGAPLSQDFEKKLKLEWLRFTSLLNESRKSSLFPIGLQVDKSRGLVLVQARDSLIVPVKEESVVTLHRELLSTTTSSSSLSLFTNYPQSSFIQLVELIKSINSKLSLRENRLFESLLLKRLATPFTTDIEDVSLSLFEETPRLESLSSSQDVLQGLKNFLEPSKTIESFCQLLLSTHTTSFTDSPSSSLDTDLSRALLTDLMSESIQARYDLAKGLVLLLVCAWGAAVANSDGGQEEEGEALVVVPPMASFEQTTSYALTTFNSISILQWTQNQIEYPSNEMLEIAILRAKKKENDDDDVGLDEKFKQMKMMTTNNNKNNDQNKAEVSPVSTYSLLNSIVRINSSLPSISTSFSLSNSLTDVAVRFLDSTRLLIPKPLIGDHGEGQGQGQGQVEFVYTLQRLGMNDQVLELFKNYYLPSQSVGLKYVEGKAWLELGNEELASQCFEKSANGFYFGNVDRGLYSILPLNTKTLSSFYIHIVDLFVPTSFDHSIAKFSQLALDALDDEESSSSSSPSLLEQQVEKDLWMKIFTSLAKLGQFEKAYSTIQEIPLVYQELKITCLAHFISLVCENGNGNSSLLTSLSFVGLEQDLERNLAFRARNSDPMTVPNYYKILYSYHVSRGDYRSAGTVMYQQARRISEITPSSCGPSFRDLVTAQCQSYLAATNALSLVSNENSWVAIIVDNHHKRRKIQYHVPDDEYDPSSSKPLEIKELKDIRREYTIALSRLQLCTEFPELERTNFNLEPEAVVALFSQIGNFEQAFNVATSLKVDLSSVFEILAEKAVGLNLHREGTEDARWVNLSPEVSTWESEDDNLSIGSKAWKLLESHLKRHDRGPAYRYRLIVLERVLATSRSIQQGQGQGGGEIPEFLSSFLLKNQPHGLLKTLIKFDRLEEAFKFSLEIVKNSRIPSTSPSSTSSLSSFSTNLPYTLFDELLSIPPNDSPNVSNDKLKQRQEELKKVLQERKLELAKLERQLRGRF